MRTLPVLFGLVSLGWLALGVDSHVAAVSVEEILSRSGVTRGIVALAGAADATLPIALAKDSELTVFVQARNPAAAAQIRSRAYQAGLYGTRIFVDDLMDHSGSSHFHRGAIPGRTTTTAPTTIPNRKTSWPGLPICCNSWPTPDTPRGRKLPYRPRDACSLASGTSPGTNRKIPPWTAARCA